MSKEFDRVVLWLAATGWHIWNILMLRPQFQSISDSSRTLQSFVGAYFAAGLLRWLPFDGKGVFELIAGLTGHAVVLGLYAGALWLALTWKGRSRALFAIALGASAGIDLLATVLRLASIEGSVFRFVLWLLELGIIACCTWQFIQLPAHIKARGYQASRA